MTFKVDENLPTEVADLLNAAGHDALTVRDQGVSGAHDPDLAALRISPGLVERPGGREDHDRAEDRSEAVRERGAEDREGPSLEVVGEGVVEEPAVLLAGDEPLESGGLTRSRMPSRSAPPVMAETSVVAILVAESMSDASTS